MRILRRFLTPGWVIGVLAAALFAWACFALLAPWQLDKSDDLDARNARLAELLKVLDTRTWKARVRVDVNPRGGL